MLLKTRVEFIIGVVSAGCEGRLATDLESVTIAGAVGGSSSWPVVAATTCETAAWHLERPSTSPPPAVGMRGVGGGWSLFATTVPEEPSSTLLGSAPSGRCSAVLLKDGQRLRAWYAKQTNLLRDIPSQVFCRRKSPCMLPPLHTHLPVTNSWIAAYCPQAS